MRLRLDHGDGRHVDDAAGGHRQRENVGGTRGAHPNGPDRQRVGEHLDDFVGDVGGVEFGHDQHVRFPFEPRVRKNPFAERRIERGIAVQLAVDLERRVIGGEQRGCRTHLGATN